MSWPCLGLGLLLLASGAAAGPQEKKPVPLYTNDDLDRVAPRRDETGVNSRPGPLPSPLAVPSRPSYGRKRDEAYWRREAERLHDRLAPLRLRLADLRARIAAGEADPVRGRSRSGSRAPSRSGSRSLSRSGTRARGGAGAVL